MAKKVEERHKSRGRKSKTGTGKLRITGLIRSPKEDRQLQTAKKHANGSKNVWL